MSPTDLRALVIGRFATLWRAAQAFDASRSGGWLLQQIESGVTDDRLRNWLEHHFNIKL